MAEHLQPDTVPRVLVKIAPLDSVRCSESLKIIQENTRLTRVLVSTRCRVGNSEPDVDITNTHFCSLLLLGSENISRILHKEAVPGFPLEIVVAKDNEFLQFQAFVLWRTLRYFFNSSADSIQDEMEFQGDPVSSLNFPSPNPHLCASAFSFS